MASRDDDDDLVAASKGTSRDAGWEQKAGIRDMGEGRYAVHGLYTSTILNQLKRYMDKAKATEGISRIDYEVFDVLRRDEMTNILDVNSKLARIDLDKDSKKIRMAQAHVANIMSSLISGDLSYHPVTTV